MSETQIHKRPQIAYRVQLEKRIEINKSFSEKRNQAVAMRILSYGLFGQKRYQNLYLTCSLNCFHLALKIANNIHQRVAGLAMIIKFDIVQVLEYFLEPVGDQFFEEKKYSKIIIKLTRSPTEEDKKQAGFHKGLTSDEVDQPLQNVLQRRGRLPREPQRKDDRRQKEKYKGKNEKHGKNQSQIKYQERDNNRREGQYRQNKHQRIEGEYEHRRGETKTRGQGYRGSAGRRQNDEKDRHERHQTHHQQQYKQKEKEGGKEEGRGRRVVDKKNQQQSNKNGVDHRRGDRVRKRRYDDQDD